MRIAKAALIDPNENALYATAAVALSIFIFAYSARIGQVSILAYYALWLPLVLVDYRRVLGNYMRYLPLFCFGIFAFLSSFWSAVPSLSLRTATQYISHIVCALIIARMVTMHVFVRAAILGIGMVLAYSLAFGQYFLDPLDGSFSFVGAFDSKNQLGFYASLGLYFIYVAFFIQAERSLWLFVYAVIALMAAYSLHAAQSATSVLTVFAVIGALMVLKTVTWLTPRHRIVLFIAGVVFGIGAMTAFIYGGGVDLVLGAFGKDSTLTGRTYLWSQGYAAAALNPILGVGYQAYWVQGFSEPERLWYEFYIASRQGFHFHNTFIETTVETGLVGVALLASLLLRALFSALKRILVHKRDPEGLMLFGIAMLLLERAFVEIDTLTPYHVGSFLLYFTLGRLVLNRLPVQATSPSARFTQRMAGQRDYGLNGQGVHAGSPL